MQYWWITLTYSCRINLIQSEMNRTSPSDTNPSQFLDFEQPIVEIKAKIDELRRFDSENDVDFSDEISRLEKQRTNLERSIFSSLTPWQITQLARHPMRPYTLDYIDQIFTDFHELHGDRAYADDAAIVTGLARFNDRGVALIGHQKGRNTNTKIKRNFGMPRPEGYRKAQRLIQLAEQFSLPIFTFVDTPGAHPGFDAESRGQSQAIATSMLALIRARCPIISTVIGEGGSGGALAIGVADEVIMLEYSIYSVISPEGCASILWKDSGKAADAAEVLGLTSAALAKHGLIDVVVKEPLGGAHQNLGEMADRLKQQLQTSLEHLSYRSMDELLQLRETRLRSYGEYLPAH